MVTVGLKLNQNIKVKCRKRLSLAYKKSVERDSLIISNIFKLCYLGWFGLIELAVGLGLQSTNPIPESMVTR